jgi:outer membrane protein OmpA-like peptidoglycan-associated protein/uncharacterized protein YidB (DUF937 family)
MGTLDAILAEAGSQFGISSAKSSSLLSSLITMITETPGGLGGFLDRFRKAGLGDMVSSWLSGSSPRALTSSALESTIGRDSIDKIASKAGLSATTASSALAFMVPNLIQRLAPGGVIPTHLSSDILAYASSATSAVAAGTRQAAYATERAVKKAGVPAWLWPLVALLAVFLLGYWLWNSRTTVTNTAFNVEEQVRLATQKAGAALAALKPGFTAQDLISALNLNVINFATGSAQIPVDEQAFLNKVAIAIKAAPAGTTLEIRGHTDNSGDAAANMTLSQQRADAVRNYLIQQGVDPAMLTAKGYGDTQPVGSNDTDEGKFRNRRIEFAIR